MTTGQTEDKDMLMEGTSRLTNQPEEEKEKKERRAARTSVALLTETV